MDSNKLLRKFEKKFFQLASLERLLLDARKTKLFLQVIDEALEDMFFVLLVDKSTKEGLTNVWRRSEDVLLLVTKQ